MITEHQVVLVPTEYRQHNDEAQGPVVVKQAGHKREYAEEGVEKCHCREGYEYGRDVVVCESYEEQHVVHYDVAEPHEIGIHEGYHQNGKNRE